MIKYYRLFDTLNRRGMKLSDLLVVLSSSTLAKLRKGAPLETTTIEKICTFLHCDVSDIMEFISDTENGTEK